MNLRISMEGNMEMMYEINFEIYIMVVCNGIYIMVDYNEI